ncbi:MAG: hypothetical protein E6G01_07925 [Actinobacteria bacterium]|nr:MAG: hypothetical protein E6G01_07925 [Actinomycetota bacterium]
MSNQHKKALAEGREQGRAIRRYLDALARQKPRRGRRRTVESANRQLRETVDQLSTASSLARVELVQRRIDLEAEIANMGQDGGGDLTELEAGFVAAAKSYSERKGITVQAWLQGGVPRSVLRQAGLTSARQGVVNRSATTRARGAAKTRRRPQTRARTSSKARRPAATRKVTPARRRSPAKVSKAATSRRGRPAASRSTR